jgi:hypothetical protein
VQAFGGADENAATHNARPAAGGAALRHSVRGHPVSDVIEGTLWNRELGSVSEDVVTALVHQLFEGIRDYLVQATEMKFNCFFLMPIIDTFPNKLREELEAAYETNLEDVFDVALVRHRCRALAASCAEAAVCCSLSSRPSGMLAERGWLL